MYQVCPGEADGFTLDGTYDPAIDIMSDADSTCINDFIGIEGRKTILKLLMSFLH